MEIWEARELLNKAYEEFLTKEAPNNPRVLIILKQIEELGYDPPILILQGGATVKPNKAIKSSIERRKRKTIRIENWFRRKLNRRG